MKQFFKRFLPYLMGNWRYFFYALFGSILVAVSTAGTAHLVEPILQKIFFEKDKAQLIILPFMIMGVYSLKAVGTYIQAYFIAYIGQTVIFRLRNEILEKMLSFEIAFFNQRRSGELISRIMNDISQVQAAISNYCAEFVRETLTLFGLVGILIYKSPTLAFYGLVVMPLALYPLRLLARKMKDISKKTQEKNSDVTSRLTEIFSNIEVLKASGSEVLEVERFKKENSHLLKLGLSATRTGELASPIMEVLGAIAAGVVIFVGGMQVIDGDIKSPQFFSFMTALFLLYAPIKRLSTLHNKFQVAIAAGERIFELKNRESLLIDGTQELESVQEIHINHAHLSYDGQKDALKDICLHLKRGDSLALVGNSGGGKSSIVSLILRFYDPTYGEVLINNENIKTFLQKSLRKKIAVVTQRISIFNESIAYNVAYGALAYQEPLNTQKVIESLKRARAWEFVKQLPQGIDTLLEESGTNLSGGQRQRIAIARVLYQNPDILILDEATSALDNKTEAAFKDTLREVMKDKITLIIAHRLSTIELAKQIAFVKQGEIKAIGTQEEVLKQSSEFAEFYQHSFELSRLDS